jgi:hypothetical protein
MFNFPPVLNDTAIDSTNPFINGAFVDIFTSNVAIIIYIVFFALSIIGIAVLKGIFADL